MRPLLRHWSPGHLLSHRENRSLGIGRVVAVHGRVLEVDFPAAAARLRLAAASPSLLPHEWRTGMPVRHLETGREGVVAAALEDGRVRLQDGSVHGARELWPLDLDRDLLERLAAGEADCVDDFVRRLDALHLLRRREASGLGSFLGGRIRLFPHQLHVAERATAAEPVRWLLADEVGLGKTVETCLILNRLVSTGRIERCLIVAPATLTVQWLGELWRKHHQVFALLDSERLDDVARDFGRSFNPFDVHRRAVVALETLIERPRLTQQAEEAGIDLLVVDEAHRLRRPRGHPGSPAYRAVQPITALGRHVLLLTATPLEDDAHGFFRLLQLLRPDEFPEEGAFEDRLARALPLPPCTSSTRREDVGGMPPRVAVPVEVPPGARAALEQAVLELPESDPLVRRRKLDRLQRALASGAALSAVLAPGEDGLGRLAEEADATDPRLRWLAEEAPEWKAAGDKTLVFVAHRETLELVRTWLSRRAQLATAAFHEDLSPARRDIEVAQFRSAEGPSVLVSTECGGEGRNFEFCTRLVLFDLPWNPSAVEQRIGRLDRIGRRRAVEIVFFRPPAGIGRRVAEVFEAVGLFREPLAGLDPELASVAAALESAALAPSGATVPAIDAALSAAEAARQRIRQAAFRELHRDRYRGEMAGEILARVPTDLDELNQDVVTGLAERLGFAVEAHRAARTFSIELGHDSLVDGLPGVPGGSSFLGTFDRELAVVEEALDYFATGHPLVEGLLAHLDESPLGRVAVLGITLPGGRGVGLLALYRTATGFETVALDGEGRSRPDWAEALARRPLRSRRVPEERLRQAGWPERVRALAKHLDPARPPVAVAALVFDDGRASAGG